MATENPAKENKKAAEAPEPPLIDQIGTLTYPRAVQHFGKSNALAAMRRVAEIGGHGHFEDEHFMSPLFGGLQMPDPAKILEPKKEDFASLPESDFHFQAAVEQWEENKKKASANRQEINRYFKSLK